MGTAEAEPGQRRQRRGGAGETAAWERRQRLRRKYGGETGSGESNCDREGIIYSDAGLDRKSVVHRIR